jgi:hypothetical protein
MLGEDVGDRLFDTALIPRKRDAAEDIFFGTAGGLIGITIAGVVAFLRPPHQGIAIRPAPTPRNSGQARADTEEW